MIFHLIAIGVILLPFTNRRESVSQSVELGLAVDFSGRIENGSQYSYSGKERVSYFQRMAYICTK